MNKRTIIGGLVGGITFFLLGWLFYGMLLGGVFNELNGSEMPDPNLPVLFVGNLFFGFLLAIVFDRWAGIGTAAGGFRGGALLGFFIGAGIDFVLLGTTSSMNIYSVLLDIVVTTVMFAITGAVVAAVLGKIGPR